MIPPRGCLGSSPRHLLSRAAYYTWPSQSIKKWCSPKKNKVTHSLYQHTVVVTFQKTKNFTPKWLNFPRSESGETCLAVSVRRCCLPCAVWNNGQSIFSRPTSTYVESRAKKRRFQDQPGQRIYVFCLFPRRETLKWWLTFYDFWGHRDWVCCAVCYPCYQLLKRVCATGRGGVCVVLIFERGVQ